MPVFLALEVLRQNLCRPTFAGVQNSTTPRAYDSLIWAGLFAREVILRGKSRVLLIFLSLGKRETVEQQQELPPPVVEMQKRQADVGH